MKQKGGHLIIADSTLGDSQYGAKRSGCGGMHPAIPEDGAGPTDTDTNWARSLDLHLEGPFDVSIRRGRVDRDARAGAREERCHLIGERPYHQVVREDLIRGRDEFARVFLPKPPVAHLPSLFLEKRRRDALKQAVL